MQRDLSYWQEVEGGRRCLLLDPKRGSSKLA